jgi:hypothetical protein
MDKRRPEAKTEEPELPVWLTRDQVAQRLGKALKSVQTLVRLGYLHPIQRNGNNLYALAEVERLARPGRRPPPWLASFRRIETLSPGAAPKTAGREAAVVFRLLERNKSLREIVIQLQIPPHRVRALYREWKQSLDQGPPADALVDGPDLDSLAVAAQELFARKG